MFSIKGSKLLVVDDEPANTDLLKRIFSKQQCDVLALNNGDTLFETILQYEPDLIILDVMMPGKTGFDLTREVKAHAEWKHIPIILLTALMDRESCIMGLEAGAEDFVSKPFNLRELRARVSNLLQLKKQGDFLRRHIQVMTHYDAVTNLPNRTLLEQMCESLLREDSQEPFNFAICQTLSDHQVQQLIKANNLVTTETEIYRALVNRLSRHLPQDSLIGSLGNGKFAIVIRATEQLAYLYLKACWMALSRPFIFDSKEIQLPFTFGMNPARYMVPAWSGQVNRAELALAEASKNSLGVVVFESWMDAVNDERLRLSQALYGSLQEQHFHLCFQPQFNIQTDTFLGFEGLLRWTHPEYGPIPPDLFIPLAEANGIINELGIWVIEATCKALSRWRSMNEDIHVSVNVSAIQLQRPGLIDTIERMLRRYQLDTSQLEIELTESTLANPSCDLQIQQFWEKGFAIAIDDFGTGYSNLSYLKKYPFQRVKIDRSFVQNVCSSKWDLAIIRAVIAMAEHLNFTVIAEGVENGRQLELLRQVGCHQVQGFLLGKPLSFANATELVRKYSDKSMKSPDQNGQFPG